MPDPTTSAGAADHGATAPAGTTIERRRSRRISDIQASLGDEPPVVFMLQREMDDPYVVAYFTVDGEPESKARARWNTQKGGKPHTPQQTRQAQERIGWLFRQAAGPLRVVADRNFGVFAAFFCATYQRRDVDNMLKLVLDGLTKVVWDDDSQVTEAAARVVRGVPADQARSEILIYHVLSQPSPTRNCDQCGKPYLYYRSLDKRRFCSRDCGYAWRRAKNERTCGNCGETFQSAAEAKYCSKTCAYAAKHVQLTCTYCGATFTNARSTARRSVPMCSAECRMSFWREHRQRVAAGTCDDCGGSTSKKSYKRCQACHLAALGVATGRRGAGGAA